MIFTLLLLLTETRDLQRRRKYGYGYQLLITDRHRINDNWRDEYLHRAKYARYMSRSRHQRIFLLTGMIDLQQIILFILKIFIWITMLITDVFPKKAHLSIFNIIRIRITLYIPQTTTPFLSRVLWFPTCPTSDPIKQQAYAWSHDLVYILLFFFSFFTL